MRFKVTHMSKQLGGREYCYDTIETKANNFVDAMAELYESLVLGGYRDIIIVTVQAASERG